MSVAEIKQVKGVQFNFVNFLWKEMVAIRELERSGNYLEALRAAVSLIKYLPESFKKSLEKKADTYRESLAWIEANMQGIDQFNTRFVRHRAMQQYASLALPDLMDDLSKFMDESGYMERRDDVPEGKSHTWVEPIE